MTGPGCLIVNADDWGRDTLTTDRILDCAAAGAVSAVSAMVFMADSERAAAIAIERNLDAGLHLNFTTAFSAATCPSQLVHHQSRLAAYLRRSRFNQLVFHPGLSRSFEYVVSAQLEEYCRLYGRAPGRIDGHHHMHLCANVLGGGLLPSGTLVRRNVSLQRGEKSTWNRLYRRLVDRRLQRRHRLVDYLFNLLPLDPPDRLGQIFALARRSIVELETHPVAADEYRFLAGGEIFRRAPQVRIAPASAAW